MEKPWLRSLRCPMCQEEPTLEEVASLGESVSESRKRRVVVKPGKSVLPASSYGTFEAFSREFNVLRCKSCRRPGDSTPADVARMVCTSLIWREVAAQHLRVDAHDDDKRAFGAVQIKNDEMPHSGWQLPVEDTSQVFESAFEQELRSENPTGKLIQLRCRRRPHIYLAKISVIGTPNRAARRRAVRHANGTAVRRFVCLERGRSGAGRVAQAAARLGQRTWTRRSGSAAISVRTVEVKASAFVNVGVVSGVGWVSSLISGDNESVDATDE